MRQVLDSIYDRERKDSQRTRVRNEEMVAEVGRGRDKEMEIRQEKTKTKTQKYIKTRIEKKKRN